MKEGLSTRLTLFFVPIIISTAVVMALFFWLSEGMFLIIGALLLGYFISPFGREVLIPLAIIAVIDLKGLISVPDLILIAITVVFVDVMCSLFIIWNLELLNKLPRIGNLIRKFAKAGRSRLEKSRRSKIATLSLTLYVALPFQGSGGVASSIFGMMGGMRKRNVLAAVVAGSAIGSFTIAVAGWYVAEALVDIFGSAVYLIFGLLVLIAVIAFLVFRFFKNKQEIANSQ